MHLHIKISMTLEIIIFIWYVHVSRFEPTEIIQIIWHVEIYADVQRHDLKEVVLKLEPCPPIW